MIVTITPVNDDGTLAEPTSYQIPDVVTDQGAPGEEEDTEEWRPDPVYAAGYANTSGYMD